MHRTTVSAVFLVMSFFASGMVWPDHSFASESLPMTVKELPVTRDDDCQGSLSYKQIEGVGERPLCATATLNAGAHFRRGVAQPFAFRKSYDPKLYEMTNLCLNGGCVYAPETDELWEKRPNVGVTYTLYRYTDFSRNVRPIFEAIRGYWAYEYTGPAAEQMLQGIMAYGVSNNGRWVAAEVRDRGLALISSETGTIRRIAPILHHYGRGYDPQFQIAVQNDGRRLYLGGINVSPSVVTIDETCGDTVVGGLLSNDGFSSPGLVSCEVEVLSFAPTLPTYRYSHHPRFDDDIDAVQVLVRSMSGADYLVEKRFSERPEAKLGYIALGDSFTSGEGEDDDGRYLPGTNTEENRCHLSGRSYPFLLIKTPLPMRSQACSGATSAHLLAANGTLPAQLDAVRRHQPDVVTTSIGGNDLDLVGKLAACSSPGTCVWAKPEYRFLTAREAAMLYDRLVDTFTEVRASAPVARHFAVGYPLAIDPNGECDVVTKLLLTADERRYLFEAQRLLNTVVSAAARRSSVPFIDISRAYSQHALCSGTTTPAMNGLRFGDDIAPIPGMPQLTIIGNESFHPTPFGHSLAATIIDTAIATDQHPLCEYESCYALFSPDDSYWGDQTSVPLVYKLDYERQEDGGARVVSDGLFAPNTTVSASMFSEEVALGSVATSQNGTIRVEISAEQLGDDTHTVLLKGTNEKNQEVIGYTIVRAQRAERASAIQNDVIGGVDGMPHSSNGPNIREEPSRVGQIAPSQPVNEPQRADSATRTDVLGVQNEQVSEVQSEPSTESIRSIEPWLAPFFATIGLSLGIIALWLYFVRS